MKKLKFVLFAFIMALFVNCTNDDDGIQPPINIPTTVEDVEFPFASITGVTIEGPINIHLDVDFNEIVKEKTKGILSLDNVKKAELKEFSIELNDSNFIGDLSAVKDADIYVKAENPTVKELKVAEVRDNKNKDKIIFKVVTDKNLIDYFKSEDTYVVLRKITGGDASLTTFNVTIKPVWRMGFDF
ncbi:hypothetical protein KRX57_00965 [Weeksellaceae bacterium TAE3-ERU29]|nr:hypothetical protein [Weeksellaceae bacterium TAE3-ERU29]